MRIFQSLGNVHISNICKLFFYAIELMRDNICATPSIMGSVHNNKYRGARGEDGRVPRKSHADSPENTNVIHGKKGRRYLKIQKMALENGTSLLEGSRPGRVGPGRVARLILGISL